MTKMQICICPFWINMTIETRDVYLSKTGAKRRSKHSERVLIESRGSNGCI